MDGSKVREVASRKALVSRRELAAQAQRNAQEIDHYLKLLDAQDSQDAARRQASADVQQALQRRERDKQAIQAELQQFMAGQSTLVTTEPQARSMHGLHSIKHRILGNARLLMRGIGGAQAELSLAELVYNLKRVFNMKGAAWMNHGAGLTPLLQCPKKIPRLSGASC